MSADQVARTLALLRRTPGWDGDEAMAEAVLDAALRLSEGQFASYGIRADREGARLEGGRVVLPKGSDRLWSAYAHGGWLALDLPEARGGAGLPLLLQAAVMPLFEKHATAFMMLPGVTRAAAHLLGAVAPAEIAEEWVPALGRGERAAAICITEPGAGSDVGRVRTRAERDGDSWRITGEKIWISFGDHPLAPIGHCLIARTSAAPGSRGLSLFLVDGGEANGITVERVERKLGLHGSPSCHLRLAGARGRLLGEEGRGLPALFAMISLMRLQTGGQGVGIATACVEAAETHAGQRRQGGPAEAPIAIVEHPPVARRLARMRAETEVARAAHLEAAALMDRARAGDAEAGALAGWLLPLVKTFGGETGQRVADDAIQTLGGAGYAEEGPVARHWRDARALTIYEGTTDIQAHDFLARRTWGGREGLSAFLRTAEDGAATALFATMANRAAGRAGDPKLLGGAEFFMRAGWLAVQAWLAPRLGDEGAPLIEALPERMAVLGARSGL